MRFILTSSTFVADRIDKMIPYSVLYVLMAEGQARMDKLTKECGRLETKIRAEKIQQEGNAKN